MADDVQSLIENLTQRLDDMEKKNPGTKALRRRLFSPRTVSRDMLQFTSTELQSADQSGNLTLTTSYQTPTGLSLTIPDSGRYLVFGQVTLANNHVSDPRVFDVTIRNTGTTLRTNTFGLGAGRSIPVVLLSCVDFVAGATFDLQAKSDGSTTLAKDGQLSAVRMA